MPDVIPSRDQPFLGFNEAEARAPRMLPGTATIDAVTAGFNEAEARAPRMPARRLWGSSNISDSFNEAEARAPRMR